MVWRTKHRAGRRKRERIAALKKGPVISSVETGRYISDKAKQQLRRSAWRSKHANRSADDNIEIIDLTLDLEEPPIPKKADKLEFASEDIQNLENTELSQSTYTTTVTKYFAKIEQYLLTMKYSRENQINN